MDSGGRIAARLDGYERRTEQLEMADVPKPLQNVPIAFICTGIMSIAFMGFALK